MNSPHVTKRVIVGGIITALLIAHLLRRQSDLQAPAAMHAQVPQRAAIAESIPASHAPATPAVSSAAASSSRQVRVSRSAQIDRLIASGTPEDAFEAASQLFTCSANRELAHSDRTDLDIICGDITPGQLTLRAGLAEKAALAGVHGAAALYAVRAPDGRRNTEVWNDPAYAEWREHAWQLLHRNGQHGDLGALGFMRNSYLRGVQGDDRLAVVKYEAAYAEAQKLSEPWKSNPRLLAEANRQLNEKIAGSAADLDPKQVERAIAAGKAMINEGER